jgi:multicomponent Na+:H+ antiporter subunit D
VTPPSPLALGVLLPIAAGLLAAAFGRRGAWVVGLFGAAGTLATALWLAQRVLQAGVQRYAVSGWAAPLGIELRADGVGAAMLLLNAVVGVAVSLYALLYWSRQASPGGGRGWLEADSFWPLWFLLWGAMNALYLSADLFNLYVTLELMTLAAVGLVILAGSAVSLAAGMRYLLMALTGSLLYLFGVALLYARYGTLALEALPSLLVAGAATWVALALMTAGLLVKAALWPFHVWLPPAHASAAAPVSALLSALVVKAPFYLVLRLWFEVFPELLPPLAWQGLGVLGAVAIVWGSLRAVRQTQLKRLIAYSTVAQLGYLFLGFPLGVPAAGLMHAFAHALAKAALFMVAGAFTLLRGGGTLGELAGAARQRPLSALALLLGIWTLLGLPPSAGYLSKELLLTAALASDQAWWVWVLRVGPLLAALYLALALRPLVARRAEEAVQRAPGQVTKRMELVPLGLALLAALFGTLPYGALLRFFEVRG